MIVKINKAYLENLLEQRSLKLKQLAVLSNVNYGTLRNIVGENQNTSYETAKKIMSVLKVSSKKLFYIQFDSEEEKNFYLACRKVAKK